MAVDTGGRHRRLGWRRPRGLRSPGAAAGHAGACGATCRACSRESGEPWRSLGQICPHLAQRVPALHHEAVLVSVILMREAEALRRRTDATQAIVQPDDQQEDVQQQ